MAHLSSLLLPLPAPSLFSSSPLPPLPPPPSIPVATCRGRWSDKGLTIGTTETINYHASRFRRYPPRRFISTTSNWILYAYHVANRRCATISFFTLLLLLPFYSFFPAVPFSECGETGVVDGWWMMARKSGFESRWIRCVSRNVTRKSIVCVIGGCIRLRWTRCAFFFYIRFSFIFEIGRDIQFFFFGIVIFLDSVIIGWRFKFIRVKIGKVSVTIFKLRKRIQVIARFNDIFMNIRIW